MRMHMHMRMRMLMHTKVNDTGDNKPIPGERD